MASSDGMGWDTHEITFWEEPIPHFRYPYLALPGLRADDYLDGPNILAVALTALMEVPAQRKLDVSAEALRRIAECGEERPISPRPRAVATGSHGAIEMLLSRRALAD